MKKQAKGAMKGAAGLSVVTNMCVVQNPKTFFFTWPTDFHVREVGATIDHQVALLNLCVF